MSMPDTPGGQPQRRLDLGSAILILVGVVLLLPGVCAVFSAIGMMPMMLSDPWLFLLLAALWIACLAVGYGGLKLIQRGWRG